MKILLTGANGQLGWELARALAPLGEVLALERQALDLAEPAAIRAKIRQSKPGIIVNAGAYTAVDQAESEPERAMAINATAPGILAEEARRIGATVVQYSTDYVFDGEKNGAYVEDDPTHPLGAYGASKLAGEQAVRASGVPHLILRTSWIYAARGRNFLLTMLRLAQEREELRVVDDQRGAPTWSRTVAEATARILARKPFPEAAGTYHLTASGATTWHGFAAAIVAALPPARRRAQRVVPIPTHAFPTPAKRPKNSVLSNEKLRRAFDVSLPDWSDSLAACLRELDLSRMH